MKKNVITGLICCTYLVTGCVGSMHTTIDPVAIEFRPVIANDTRAVNSMPFPQERTFSLWAEDVSLKTLYMQSEQIAYNGGWFAPKSWIDGNLSFHACYPADLPAEWSQTNGLTITAFDSSKGDVDILIAKAEASYKADSPVTLSFEHILSRVEFKITQSLPASMDVILNRVELSGVALQADYNKQTEDSWNRHSSFESYVIYNDPEGLVINSGETLSVGKEFYAIPQATPGTITVNCMIRYGTANPVPQTYEIDPVEIFWESSKHYTYTLNIRSDKMTYSSGISSMDQK